MHLWSQIEKQTNTVDTLKSKPVFKIHNQILQVAGVLPAVAELICGAFSPFVLISEYTTFSVSAPSVHKEEAKGSVSKFRK